MQHHSSVSLRKRQIEHDRFEAFLLEISELSEAGDVSELVRLYPQDYGDFPNKDRVLGVIARGHRIEAKMLFEKLEQLPPGHERHDLHARACRQQRLAENPLLPSRRSL